MRHLNTKLSNAIPAHIREQLREIKAEAKIRKQRILDKAERFETWQEIQLSTYPIKGRR